MGENTKIPWAHHSFNPWYGCQKVSAACDYCYAEGWAKRSGLVAWGPNMERRRSSPANWKKPLAWDDEARRQGIRYRVFCGSLCDVFDNAVPPQWRSELFRIIAETPNLDWLLLTKRIDNAAEMVKQARDGAMVARLPTKTPAWPWPNVWVGITVCNQEEADRDILKLLGLSAPVRFLSLEPLLGPVDVTPYLEPYCNKGRRPHPDGRGGVTCMRCNGSWQSCPGVDWVIVGCESGSHRRLMEIDWAISLKEQCSGAKVPFFMKQIDVDGKLVKDVDSLPEMLKVRQFP
jgi:protein gp37